MCFMHDISERQDVLVREGHRGRNRVNKAWRGRKTIRPQSSKLSDDAPRRIRKTRGANPVACGRWDAMHRIALAPPRRRRNAFFDPQTSVRAKPGGVALPPSPEESTLHCIALGTEDPMAWLLFLTSKIAVPRAANMTPRRAPWKAPPRPHNRRLLPFRARRPARVGLLGDTYPSTVFSVFPHAATRPHNKPRACFHRRRPQAPAEPPCAAMAPALRGGGGGISQAQTSEINSNRVWNGPLSMAKRGYEEAA